MQTFAFIEAIAQTGVSGRPHSTGPRREERLIICAITVSDAVNADSTYNILQPAPLKVPSGQIRRASVEIRHLPAPAACLSLNSTLLPIYHLLPQLHDTPQPSTKVSKNHQNAPPRQVQPFLQLMACEGGERQTLFSCVLRVHGRGLVPRNQNHADGRLPHQLASTGTAKANATTQHNNNATYTDIQQQQHHHHVQHRWVFRRSCAQHRRHLANAAPSPAPPRPGHVQEGIAPSPTIDQRTTTIDNNATTNIGPSVNARRRPLPVLPPACTLARKAKRGR